MAKERPKRLGQKLTAIRKALELSQNGMVRRFGLSGKLTREEVSAYERGIRQPSLPTLLRYARIAGVHLEDLVDDKSDLPARLPGNVKYKGMKSTSSLRAKRR